jgi:hypothetical protein
MWLGTGSVPTEGLQQANLRSCRIGSHGWAMAWQLQATPTSSRNGSGGTLLHPTAIRYRRTLT